MPFVQRAVEPKFLSRTSLRDSDGKPRVSDEELQAVTNCTLSNALRQLASLVLLAEDIFSELTSQLQDITERSKVAQTKIIKINELVEQYDPKKVPVREYKFYLFVFTYCNFYVVLYFTDKMIFLLQVHAIPWAGTGAYLRLALDISKTPT